MPGQFPSVFLKARLYQTSSSSSPYIDPEHMQPDIKAVENYGETGTIDLVNNLSSTTRNLLSSTCTWSDGSAMALKTGLFLRLYTGSTSGDLVGIFVITQISASDDVIQVTFGDYLQILRATGADYWRNHYNSAQQHSEAVLGGWDSVGSRLYLRKPSGVTIDASRGDVQWAVPTVYSYNHDDYWNDAASVYCTYPRKYRGFVGSVVIRVRAGSTYSASLIIGGTTVATASEAEVTSDRDVTLTLSTPVEVTTSTSVVLRVTNNNLGAWFDLDKTTGLSSGSCVVTYFGSSGSTTETGVVIAATFHGTDYQYATAGEEGADGTTYYITSIGSLSIDSSYGVPGYVGRAIITYYTMEGGMLMHTIFRNICFAAGCTPDIITSTRDVGIFRCGGGYYHNYLLALADMEEPSGTYVGRQHTIMVVPNSWDNIALRYRYKASDTAVATLYYAGDSAPSSSAIPMMSFAPSLTMSNRPRLAVTRGTSDDDSPIIVAVRDPDVDMGSSSLVVDSSATTAADAALASYKTVATNRSTDWEGSITLSGIHTDLWVFGDAYAGGVPVRIYDSRYGMDGYPARVREIEWNYEEQQTILTLNNYSEVYSSSLSNTTSMAYVAGNVAVSASSDDVYTLQYIRLESETALPSVSSHTIQIEVDGVWYSESADAISIIDMGVVVLSAYFPRGEATTEDTQYAVTRVRVDNSSSYVLEIPPFRCPDKYSNQSLIVNVQAPL